MDTQVIIVQNAKLVLAEEVLPGWLVTEHGRITEFGTGNPPERGEDFEGDYLVPGLIELHTDHLETHFRPRPGVKWNPTSALISHDAQMACAGMTTVFNALRIGSDKDSRLTLDDIGGLVAAISSGGELTRAEHFVHLRCEVSAPSAAEEFHSLQKTSAVRLASLMDHTPGQRQFADIDKAREFYVTRNNMSQADFSAYLADRQAHAAGTAEKNRQEIAKAGAAMGIVLASHDDASKEHISEAVDFGVAIAEFPTTIEAAEAAREAGLKILMGGTNIIRGGSHTGNVSALELAKRGLLDIVSSDYVPSSALQAAFAMSTRLTDYDLPSALHSVTTTPAQALGLNDRGAIAKDLRADFLRIRQMNGIPVVRSVWREGLRVA